MRRVDPPRDMTRIPADPPTDARRPTVADGPGSARPSDDLRQRMDHLPAGHPSSPYEADGRRREPGASLRDLNAELEATRPLTDAEWPEHRTDVRSQLASADDSDLETDHLHTVDEDRKIWTVERNRLQGELVADLYEEAKDVPSSGRAIIAGGLPGSGKSTILSEQAGIDLSKYLTINPDDIKEKMAERGMIPHVEGLSPMEASHLAHEESSLIAKRLALRAVADRKNIIWDITMSSRESTEKRITQLHDAGYTVEGIFVDIPIETSVRRADARHRKGHDDYRAGIGLGGRYVPAEVIEAQANPVWGSDNREVFEDVNHLLQPWRRYDNSVDDRDAVMTADSLANDQDREETA
jgi:predicted ABC-type ATPase